MTSAAGRPGGWCLGAAAGLAAALALTGAASAQQSGQGGIVTEQLAPLAPADPPVDPTADPTAEAPGDRGTIDRGDRFKLVPFRGATVTVMPEMIEPVETVEASGARLRGLDKMTGRTQTVEIASGAEAMVDRLRIRVETCRAPADNAQHGTMAFLRIWDTKHGEADPAFSGWMLAESPALSAMDHPRYDVWVISCTTSPGAAPVARQ